MEHDKPWTRADALEREVIKAEQRADKLKAINWLLLVVIAVLALTIAELKGCVRHDQGNESELPY